MTRVTVVYVVAGTVKVDVLSGRNAIVQRLRWGLHVTFPDGDGRYESTGTTVSADDHGLMSVDYADCHKFSRQNMETDMGA